MTQTAEKCQATVEVTVRPGEPVRCRTARRGKTIVDAWRAARECNRRTGLRVSLDVTLTCRESGEEGLLICCYADPDHDIVDSFAAAVTFFDSVGASPEAIASATQVMPIMVDIYLTPETDLLEALTRKVSAKVTEDDCTSKCGDQTVTEKLIEIELSRESVIVDVTLGGVRMHDYSWQGFDESCRRRVCYRAREKELITEADRILAIFEITAEVER